MGAELTPYRLEGLELASGTVTGADPQAPALVTSAVPLRRAFEAVLLAGLQKPPLLVAFSGGRDSSALLALAVALARRNGLALPVPATNLFPLDAAADELSWQERVVQHLDLPDWVRLRWGDELDLIGPEANDVLRRFGPVHPMNAHFLMPFARSAGAGTLVTGVGGDEFFMLSSWLSLLARAHALNRRGLLAAIGGLAPAILRRFLYVPAMPRLAWLNRSARLELCWQLASWESQVPRLWSRLISEHWWRSRSRLQGQRTSRALVSPYGVTLLNPFMSPEVLASAANAHRVAGFANRSRGMSEVFGDVLPRDVLERPTKAVFNRSFFGAFSREFARNWDGSGADDLPIDVDVLRRTWAAETVDARSFSLLQGLWCRSNGWPLEHRIVA